MQGDITHQVTVMWADTHATRQKVWEFERTFGAVKLEKMVWQPDRLPELSQGEIKDLYYTALLWQKEASDIPSKFELLMFS